MLYESFSPNDQNFSAAKTNPHLNRHLPNARRNRPFRQVATPEMSIALY